MVDSLRRRLRAAAGVPEAPRTTPDRLRSLVRRRRRRRRAVAVAAGVALLGVAGSTGTVLWRSPTQRIEFAEAPSPARAGAAATETTPDPAASGTGRLPPRSAPAERSGDSTPACTEVPEGFRMRDDVDIRDIGDVDGDGNPDRLWIDATRMLGISTAAGGVAPFTVDSAAPSAVSAMAVDADRRPPLELLVSDGRTAQLLVFDDCEIVPVVNTRDGRPWLFDLGFRGTGTGVGCAEILGRRKLVGLRRQGRDGDRVDYETAVLELDGRVVTVSETIESRYLSPAEDDAIDRLDQVTCDGTTMIDDGVTTPTP